jgi:hypothetical protein
MSLILSTSLAGIIAYSSHYAAAKLYAWLCVPDGIYGFIQGFLTTAGPICATLLHITSSSHVTYSTIVLTSFARLIADSLANVSKIKFQSDTGGTGG